MSQGGTLQLGLFDERNLVEISHPEFPGERLVVCRYPAHAVQRARKRDDLLAGTEAVLAKVLARVEAGSLRGAARIGIAVGRVVDRFKMAKHFELLITDDRLTVARRTDTITAEAALGGLAVLRTSVPAERLDAPGVVRGYKLLARVERAFRSVKAVDIAIRPIHHWTEGGSVRTCSCACSPPTRSGTWSGPGRPCCFATRSARSCPIRVAPAQRSAAALATASRTMTTN